MSEDDSEGKLIIDSKTDKLSITYFRFPKTSKAFKAAIESLPPEGSKTYNELISSKKNVKEMLRTSEKGRDDSVWKHLTPRLFSLPPSWAYDQYYTEYDEPEVEADTMSDRKGDAKHAGYIRAHNIVSEFIGQLWGVSEDQLPNDYELAKLMYRSASTGLASANKAIEREQKMDEKLNSIDEEIYIKGEKLSRHEVVPSDLPDGEFEMLHKEGITELFDFYRKANPKRVELLNDLEEIVLRYPEQYKFSWLIEYLSARLMLKPDTIRKQIQRLKPPETDNKD